MANYGVCCCMHFTNIVTEETTEMIPQLVELHAYLETVYPNNIDLRRGKIRLVPVECEGLTNTILFFWMVTSDQSLRDTVYTTMQSYKQYAWLTGDYVEPQYIRKYDTDLPSYSSPYNWVKDEWGGN